MKFFSLTSFHLHREWLSASVVLLALASPSAFAAPGAHGPNGEHLDASPQAGIPTGPVPSFEAHSETFEVVGRLQSGELAILINRFATNEPLLNATVEVESGNLKAPAKFHADLGDYAVDDANLLKALAAPGDHAVVVTVVAGDESDLLDGTLTVSGALLEADDHAHGPSLTTWLALALGGLTAAGWFVARRRKVRISDDAPKGDAL